MTAIAHPVEILAAGVVTPVGLDAPSAAAAVRAGISRVHESSILDRRGAPIRLSLVPDEVLPPLAQTLDPALPAPHARMLRLAALAVQQAIDHAWLNGSARPEPTEEAGSARRRGEGAARAILEGRAGPPLFLGLPEQLSFSFLHDLHVQSGGTFALPTSAVSASGGAASLLALCDALAFLQAGNAEAVLVGGVDTFLDPPRLAALDAEDRLLGDEVTDGFIPGEGAAVLLLGTAAYAKRIGATPHARLTAAARADEPHHRRSSEPCLGDGLAATLRELHAAVSTSTPARCVYAGMNGESLPAREWAVAAIRNAPRIADDARLEHPADCLGDTGAAAGALQLALAAVGLSRRYLPSPCLTWCTSDGASRAAALLEAIP